MTYAVFTGGQANPFEAFEGLFEDEEAAMGRTRTEEGCGNFAAVVPLEASAAAYLTAEPEGSPLAGLRERVREDVLDACRSDDGYLASVVREHVGRMGDAEVRAYARDHLPPEDGEDGRVLTILVPAWAWDVLSESLELDAMSGAADPELRDRVRRALDAVEVSEDEGDASS